MRQESTRYAVPEHMAPAPALFRGVLGEHNALIAGAVGSGKTVFEKGLLYAIARETTPDESELYLIDPKRVELGMWARLPHTRGYARDFDDAMRLLDEVADRMMMRYNRLEEAGRNQWRGSHIYVFIDELADLMLTDRRKTTEKLQRIMQLGRAARVHVIALSQCVSRTMVIPAPVQVNVTCSVGLRCKSAIDSRQIIGQAGCELLPRYGYCIVSDADGIRQEVVPMTGAAAISDLVSWWTSPRCARETRPRRFLGVF